jgi:hypothetical protein
MSYLPNPLPPQAKGLEVFELKRNEKGQMEAYVGYRTPSGENAHDFHFVQLPFTGEVQKISDGYHRFSELYEHRIQLYIVLCAFIAMVDQTNSIRRKTESRVWKSKLHSDGSCFEGWFVLGIHKEKGRQITYHLPMEKWEDVFFAEELDRAPEWDGHSGEEVLVRLKEFY